MCRQEFNVHLQTTEIFHKMAKLRHPISCTGMYNYLYMGTISIYMPILSSAREDEEGGALWDQSISFANPGISMRVPQVGAFISSAQCSSIYAYIFTCACAIFHQVYATILTLVQRCQQCHRYERICKCGGAEGGGFANEIF